MNFRALEFPIVRVSVESEFWMHELTLPLKFGRKDTRQGLHLFAIYLHLNFEHNWYMDPLLELVNVESIKANSLNSEHVLINISHYSRKLERQVALDYAGILYDMTSLPDDTLRVSEWFCSFPPNERGGFMWTIVDGKSMLLSFDEKFSV